MFCRNIFVLLLSIMFLSSCYTNDLALKNVKHVQDKTKALVDKLVKKNDVVFYLSFSYSNYNVVWIHRDSFIEAYDIFATKTIMYKIKETELFKLKLNKDHSFLEFSVLPEGEFIGFATMGDNNVVKGFSIPINYQEFMIRNFPERSYLENQIKKDLTLINNTRKLGER